jgi:hypothetical protein
MRRMPKINDLIKQVPKSKTDTCSEIGFRKLPGGMWKKKNEIRNPPTDPIIALKSVKRGIMIMPARNRGAIK